MSEDRTRQLPEDTLRLILRQLESLNSRMTGLEQRMTALEEKVDRRLQETRPIWEQVLSRLGDIEYSVASLNRKLLVFNEDLLRRRHRVDTTDERLRRLETESEP
jgi:chromosome segregation ATPase